MFFFVEYNDNFVYSKYEEAIQLNYGGTAFVGCMMLGIGIGLLFNQPGAGTMIGMGIGFIVMAMIRKKGS